MADLVGLLAYLLAAMGLTVLVVWPASGPSAWMRDRILRRLLWPSARGVLDCYICLSPWAALALAPLWWWQMRVMVLLDRATAGAGAVLAGVA